MPKWSYDDETEEFKGDALYFIREDGDGPIKIGRGNPASRLRTLQIGNPRPLVILGAMGNVGYTEAFWHRAFAQLALRGEWFHPDPCLLKAINWALKGENWADEVEAPAGFEQRQFGEYMLDAFDWYQDLALSGEPERASAAKALAYAHKQVADDWAVEIA